MYRKPQAATINRSLFGEQMTKEQILKWVHEFEIETGATLRWHVVQSSFGSGSSAHQAFAEFLEKKIHETHVPRDIFKQPPSPINTFS